MDSFKIYTQGDISAFVNQRDGEIKLGEKVQTIGSLSELKTSTTSFVLLGIPEDIGVRANYGIGGAKTAWSATIQSFLNIQSNSFLNGEEVLVLGHFEIEEPTDQSITGLRNKTGEIDDLIYPVIQEIVAAGKIPIVIGGGHNNAFPIIKGVSLALKQPINCVNIDAHADLRSTAEGRHSGNGFSFALQHGYLNAYRIFGLHQNYVNQALPTYIEAHANIGALYFEELLKSDLSILENWTGFIADLPSLCGLEIDLDSIANILSSAVSASGFDLNEIRNLLLRNTRAFNYLHICEGATALADGRTDLTTAKTIVYLVSDFIRALLPRIYQQPSS